MFRSIFRLRINSRVGVNFTITRSFPHSVRRPVRIVGEEEETPPIEEFSDGPRRRKPKATDVFRRSKYDGKFYIKSEVTAEPPEPDTALDSAEYPRPPWNELHNDYELWYDILCRRICKDSFEITLSDVSPCILFFFSKYMLIVKSKSRRRQENMTLLEGKRLITDALLAGVKLKALFVSQRNDIQSLPLPSKGYRLNWISYKHISKWTDVATSSGVLGKGTCSK